MISLCSWSVLLSGFDNAEALSGARTTYNRTEKAAKQCSPSMLTRPVQPQQWYKQPMSSHIRQDGIYLVLEHNIGKW